MVVADSECMLFLRFQETVEGVLHRLQIRMLFLQLLRFPLVRSVAQAEGWDGDEDLGLCVTDGEHSGYASTADLVVETGGHAKRSM